MSDPDFPTPERSAADEADADLLALPEPRRPGRRLTLVVMAVTCLVAVALLVGLRKDFSYALISYAPVELGQLARFQPDSSLANVWVRAQGELSTEQVVSYSRPLESNSYRLAPLEDNPRLWVEVRVSSAEPWLSGHFIPPDSFVGRLIPIRQAGLRLGGLSEASHEAGMKGIPEDGWVLVDGEAPQTLRWVLALGGLLLGFVVFNLYGLVHLLRPVRD